MHGDERFMIPILIFVFGSCIGSFLNAAIFRTHDGKSVMRGRSKCNVCGETLGMMDLVPILNYIVLRRRCRKCKAVISWQHPAVELATGLLFFFVWTKTRYWLTEPLDFFKGGILQIRDWIFVSYLVIIFVYDLRYMLIIDKFTIPAMVLAIVLNLWLGIVPAWSIMVGGIVIALFFWIQFSISRGTWVGGGDIRMGALMGFMLGLEYGLVALFIAYVLGAIVGTAMIAVGKAGRKTPIPFGTFLSVATLVVLFAGKQIIDWYFGLFN